MSHLSVQSISLPPIPLTSEDTASPELGVEIHVEQELGVGHELCQTGKGGREGRRRGSSLMAQVFMGGLKGMSGH